MVQRAKRRIVSWVSLVLGTALSLLGLSRAAKAQTILENQPRFSLWSVITRSAAKPQIQVQTRQTFHPSSVTPRPIEIEPPRTWEPTIFVPIPIKLQPTSPIDAAAPAPWFSRQNAIIGIREGEAVQDRDFEAFVIQQGFQINNLSAVELNAAYTEFKLDKIEKRLNEIESQMNPP